MMLDEGDQQLELIDELQRLGISYHFEDKIKHILNFISHEEGKYDRDLHSTALRFRLLRQHGFSVSQDVFDGYMNDDGDFKPSLADDIKGLLQLYEASFLLTHNENTLELAREFATKYLQKIVKDEIDGHLSSMVQNALDLPLHWRISRQNTRWFVNAYGRRPDMNPTLLELAKLDFNIVQATLQEDLKHVSSWWKQTCFVEKLPFMRDMLVEFYVWGIYGHFEPQYRHLRIMNTKVCTFVTAIDDMFDVYGTIQELQLFNDVIQRWDIEAMEKLPHYMQICFLALNNFVNETAYHVLKEEAFLVIPHLRKSWADLCGVYLQHATWYSEGYTQKLEDYMSNAYISSSAGVLLTHAFFLLTSPIEKEAVQSLFHNCDDIIRCSGLILRLENDLGTSADEMERGDVPKSIQCYMNDKGCGVEEAREHIRFVIYEEWKKMNQKLQVVEDSPFQPEFVRIAVDHARMAHCVYQHENTPGVQYAHMKERISGFLFEPISA